MPTCPICGVEIGQPGFARHVTACQRLPDDQTLLQVYESGLSQNKMSQRWGVSDSLISKAYRDRLGITEWNLAARGVIIQAKRNNGGELLQYAPLYGVMMRGGCERCPRYEECKQRQRLDLWPLCCLPTRREVALAYRDGRIGHDDRMPKWLPDLVKELTP